MRKEGNDISEEIHEMVLNILQRLKALEKKYEQEKGAIVGKGKNMVTKAMEADMEENVERILVKRGLFGHSKRKSIMDKAVEKSQTAMNRDEFLNEMDQMYR